MHTINNWQASAILNRTKSGERMGFHYSLNPYRGCSHACRYCYARESHTFLNLNVAEDFEQQLFVKHNLKERLSRELHRISSDAVIAVGTVTDPYQPLEGRHRLTRTAIELMAASGHAFTLTTKSPLLERDLDLLAPLGQRHQVGVQVSLTTLDREMLKRLEPGASPPNRRLEMIQRLSQLNIPVGVFVAPIIPGLTDDPRMLEELFAAIQESGANWVMSSTTRLSPAIREYFFAEVSRFDAPASAAMRTLYGTAQYVDHAYRRSLYERLDILYRRFHLKKSSPTLLPHHAQEQIQFALD